MNGQDFDPAKAEPLRCFTPLGRAIAVFRLDWRRPADATSGEGVERLWSNQPGQCHAENAVITALTWPIILCLSAAIALRVVDPGSPLGWIFAPPAFAVAILAVAHAIVVPVAWFSALLRAAGVRFAAPEPIVNSWIAIFYLTAVSLAVVARGGWWMWPFVLPWLAVFALNGAAWLLERLRGLLAALPTLR